MPPRGVLEITAKELGGDPSRCCQMVQEANLGEKNIRFNTKDCTHPGHPWQEAANDLLERMLAPASDLPILCRGPTDRAGHFVFWVYVVF